MSLPEAPRGFVEAILDDNPTKRLTPAVAKALWGGVLFLLIGASLGIVVWLWLTEPPFPNSNRSYNPAYHGPTERSP